MIGKLNQQQIEALLSQEFVGRIACYDKGFLYLVPISYAYDGRYVYIHTFEGTKLNIMRKNPDVCFEVDNVTDMANWKSVIAWGKFEELNDEEEQKQALKVLLQRRLPLSSSITTHIGKTWPFTEYDVNAVSGILCRIELTKKTGRFEQHHYEHVASF